ncbi:hypothetical protein MMC22_005234 [Lobaria immixta]|nr:hypothetical protein [Lobaria immixta]
MLTSQQNLEYARTLLLRLEHESHSIRIQSRKQAAQTSLLRQRALLKRVTDRLHELDQQDESDEDATSSSEDLLGVYTAASKPAPASPPPQSPSLSRRKPSPESTLRNRLHPSPSTAQQSSAPSATSSAITSSTPLLESNSNAQAALTGSLLSLATSLKNSSLAISSSLALDAETLSRATEGLDRNATGMEAAGKRMGLLRRMTEGKGWWGRMMLYAWIGGLWVLALVIVFVMPKLRF